MTKSKTINYEDLLFIALKHMQEAANETTDMDAFRILQVGVDKIKDKINEKQIK